MYIYIYRIYRVNLDLFLSFVCRSRHLFADERTLEEMADLYESWTIKILGNLMNINMYTCLYIYIGLTRNLRCFFSDNYAGSKVTNNKCCPIYR